MQMADDGLLDPLIIREMPRTHFFSGPSVFPSGKIPFESVLPIGKVIETYTLLIPEGRDASPTSASSRPSIGASSGKASNIVSGLAALVLVASATAVAPLDRVKLLLQCQNEMIKTGRLSSPYKGFTDCFTQTIKREGVLSLWRGHSASVAKIALAIPMVKVSDSVSVNYNHDFKQLRSQNLALYGLIYSTLVMRSYPFDYVRTRLANDVKTIREVGFSFDFANRCGGSRQFSNMLDVCKRTMKSDGIHGIYRGCSMVCIGGLLGSVVIGQMFDRSSEMIKKKKPWYALQLVALAETIPLVIYPFDTVSRRMMMTSGNTSKYKGAMDAFHQIVKYEGFLSLYKGAGTFFIRRHAKATVLWGLTRLTAGGLWKLDDYLNGPRA